MLATGGLGSAALGINQDSSQRSEWQLSRVYMWNYTLSDEDFLLASISLNAELANAPTLQIGVSCHPCAHAFRSPGGHANSRRPACLACPFFKNTTQTASTALSDCLCEPGHGDAANNADPAAACAPCATGHYAAGGANVACQKCGFGAVTEPALGARVFEQCMCDARIGLRES